MTTPNPRRPADADDQRARLVALRDRLTAEIEHAPAAYLAPLARQLQAVLAALAELPTPGVGALAELAARSKERTARAGLPESPRRHAR